MKEFCHGLEIEPFGIDGGIRVGVGVGVGLEVGLRVGLGYGLGRDRPLIWTRSTIDSGLYPVTKSESESDSQTYSESEFIWCVFVLY